MAGNNKAESLTGLLKGIETLKDKVNQLYSEVKKDNWWVQGGGQQEILIV